MAVRKMTISGTGWTAISAAGEEGSCWVLENKRGTGGLYISHSDSGVPSRLFGYRLFKPVNNADILLIGADNANDIYYARCQERGNRIIICVDVV